MQNVQTYLKLIQDRGSLEGLQEGLEGLRRAMNAEKSIFKAAEIRDSITATLCRLAQDELGPPLRGLLASCMTDLVGAETRALIPLVDGLITPLTAKSTEVKVLPGGRLSMWTCLERIWAQYGRLCASRLSDVLAAARIGSRIGEAAAVRVAAVRACVAAVTSASDSGRTVHEEVLKMAKSLLVDKLPNIRNPAAQLALAVTSRYPLSQEACDGWRDAR